jgi:hypothetical protein
MDAYDLYHEIHRIWSEYSAKSSGELHKTYVHMPTVLWTPEGYREVVGVKWNPDIKSIELIMDTE